MDVCFVGFLLWIVFVIYVLWLVDFGNLVCEFSRGRSKWWINGMSKRRLRGLYDVGCCLGGLGGRVDIWYSSS